MKKIKKIVVLVLVMACFMSTQVPVMAERIEFDLTIPGDTISKRADKADTEQRFYVRGYSFSNSATLMCQSVKLTDPNFQSYTASISSSVTSDDAAYPSYAQPGIYYYLHGRTSGASLRVMGYYTP